MSVLYFISSAHRFIYQAYKMPNSQLHHVIPIYIFSSQHIAIRIRECTHRHSHSTYKVDCCHNVKFYLWVCHGNGGESFVMKPFYSTTSLDNFVSVYICPSSNYSITFAHMSFMGPQSEGWQRCLTRSHEGRLQQQLM